MSHTLGFESVDRELHRDVREIARAFPKWKFEADMTPDGLPSLLAWLPWQDARCEDCTVLFVHTRSGWTAATPQGKRFGHASAFLPLVVREHLGGLGGDLSHPVDGTGRR